MLQAFCDNANKPQPPANLIEYPLHGETIQTDVVTATYAIQLLYIIHEWQINFSFKAHRYALIKEAAKLYEAAAPNILKPLVYAADTSSTVSPLYDEHWAYSTMLKIIESTTAVYAKMKGENKDA